MVLVALLLLGAAALVGLAAGVTVLATTGERWRLAFGVGAGVTLTIVALVTLVVALAA